MQDSTHKTCLVNGKKMLFENYGWQKGENRLGLKLCFPDTVGKRLLVVGFNPGGKTDPEANIIGRTVSRVISIAELQYNSFLFVNLTPVAAATPKEVGAEAIKRRHEKNKNSLTKQLSEFKPDGVLLCYGRSYKKAPQIFSEVLAMISESAGDVQYYCLGPCVPGRYPFHPLARVSNLKLQPCSKPAKNGKF